MTEARRMLIRGATVADGDGGPLIRRDLLLSEGQVAALGKEGAYDTVDAEVVDADGLIVAPGFIDVHSHADNAPLLAEEDTSKILQGVTTEVVGNCGFSLAPVETDTEQTLTAFSQRLFPPLRWGWHSFAEFLATTDAAGYVTNYAPLVGHGALRLAVLGMADRHPDTRELARMGRLLEESVDAGAFGMSTGLVYPPGVFSGTDELAALAGRLPAGRVYATHMRNEGAGLLDSIDEALEIGRRSGRHVQVSHIKASGRPSWGRIEAALERLDAARQQGVAVTQDAYPYDRSSTMLAACLPPWFSEGGETAVLARLEDPGMLARARAEVEAREESYVTGAGYDGILVSSTASHSFEGRTLAELADELRVTPFDALIEVLRNERLRASMVTASMSESDVATAVAHPLTMIGTDGLPPGVGGRPHPRMFGTFPRVLGHYVRDRGELTLPTAIAKMTALPARVFGLAGRGRITPGAVADLVAFDPLLVGDVCDYRDPVHNPAGIEWVMQAGRFVVRDGRWQGRRLGRRLAPAAAAGV